MSLPPEEDGSSAGLYVDGWGGLVSWLDSTSGTPDTAGDPGEFLLSEGTPLPLLLLGLVLLDAGNKQTNNKQTTTKCQPHNNYPWNLR